MSRSLSRPLLAAALVAALTGSALTGSALAQAGLGEPAPDFTLTGNDGIEYTLSDAFGTRVQLLYMLGYA
jgi:hypothetical protein